ncbi:MAG TPA: hypothetical protein VIH82_02040 [Acidimicrobiia bacterium]
MTELSARNVARTAARVLRHKPRRVAGTAAVVFGTTSWISAVVEVKIVEAQAPIEVDALAQLFASVTTAFGIVFYAGLLDLVLRSYLDDEPDPPLRVALRRLPLTRLLVADLVLVFGSAIAALACVIPGLVVFTLFGLVGPIVVSEDLHVVAAFRRSAHLVRPHFVMAFFLVTIPFLVEDQLLHGIDLDVGGHRLLGAFVVSAIIGASVGAIVGLLEVVLAHELRERDPAEADP